MSYDYKNKYQAGSAVETCPAVLSDEQTAQMQRFAEAAYHSVGMQSYARFDFMMDEKTGNMYCLEANTLPGMTPTSLLPQEAAAIGMSYPELCEHIIAVSMKKYEENSKKVRISLDKHIYIWYNTRVYEISFQGSKRCFMMTVFLLNGIILSGIIRLPALGRLPDSAKSYA